jgi:hypothetical protein
MRLVILLCLSACLLGCQPKNQELKLQLIRLQSAVKTGVNPADFSARVTDLRTAYKLYGKDLTPKQGAAYRKVDDYCDGCIYFWNEYQHPDLGYYFFQPQKAVAQKVGVVVGVAAYGEYDPKAVVGQIMDKLNAATEDLLNQMK